MLRGIKRLMLAVLTRHTGMTHTQTNRGTDTSHFHSTDRAHELDLIVENYSHFYWWKLYANTLSKLQFGNIKKLSWS